jgi:hypothetical protein
MIIGMIAVQVVQPSVMEKIDMGAVLHAHVLFALMAVHVIVTRNGGAEFLGLWIGRADFERVLIDMPGMGVVQVAVMQEIDMARMFERLVAASLAMGVGIMPGMQHLVRQRWSGGKRQGECGKEKGSGHANSLHHQRSRARHRRGK